MSCDFARSRCDGNNAHVQHVGPWPDLDQLKQIAAIERAAFKSPAGGYRNSTDEGAKGGYGLKPRHGPGQHWFLASVTHKNLASEGSTVHGYACFQEGLFFQEGSPIHLEELVILPGFKEKYDDGRFKSVYKNLDACILRFALTCFKGRTVTATTHRDDRNMAAVLRDVGFAATEAGDATEWSVTPQ